MTRDAKGWQQVGMLAERRIVHRMLPIANGRLLVLGGASKGGNLDSLEVINPQTSSAATSAGQ